MRLTGQYLGRLVKHRSHVFLLCFQPLASIDGFRARGAGFLSPQLHFISFFGREGQGERTVVLVVVVIANVEVLASMLIVACNLRPSWTGGWEEPSTAPKPSPRNLKILSHRPLP